MNMAITMSYRHGLLDPRPGPAADRHNASLLGPDTLGIEVTVPLLAARCGLGNVDPQHGFSDGSMAAVERATDWPLPPAGSCLVTIRADADAYGAMAVFGLRADGTTLTAPARERLDIIARADRFDRGAWPGRRPLPEAPGDIDEIGLGSQGLGGLAAGLADRALASQDGVAAVREWLLRAALPDAWRDRAVSAAAELFGALRSGRVCLRTLVANRVALVEGHVPGALRLGYRLAPVVIAVDDPPAPASATQFRRIAVAQWKTGHVDLRRAVFLLHAEERGWGGSVSIIGSPQGTHCRLSVARVLAIVLECGA